MNGEHFESLTKWEYSDVADVTVTYELANKDRFAINKGTMHEEIKKTVISAGKEINALVLEGEKNHSYEQKMAMEWLAHLKITKGVLY